MEHAITPRPIHNRQQASVALSVGEGRLVRQVVMLGDGREFDLGIPGTRAHARRLRKYVRLRMKTEPAFREAFGEQYDRWGRFRG